MKSLKLPFGIKDGKLVDVDAVPQGLDCGCFCPACGVKLVAKKGATKTHHFSHYNTKECQWAVETALHLVAKEIIQEKRKLVLPPVYLEFNEHKHTKIYDCQELAVDSVDLEKSVSDMVPDLICEAKGKRFFVEIAVTHFVDEVKLEKIRRLGISTIEISLEKLDRTLSKEMLEQILLSHSELKTWIYNAKAEKILSEIRKLATRKQSYTRGFKPMIRYCPRNNRKYFPDGHLMDDCIYCNHFVGDLSPTLCTGEAKEGLIQLAKRYGIINSGAGLIETKNLWEDRGH